MHILSRRTSVIEPLEARLAPATFINPFTITYTDVDGDEVRVHSSKPIFERGLFGIDFTSSGVGEELTWLPLPAKAAGATLTISVSTEPVLGQRDGEVHVGRISSMVDLRAIEVEGTLEEVVVGRRNIDGHTALGRLTVAELGGGEARFGLIYGKLGTLEISRSLNEFNLFAAESIGSIKIGGDIDEGSISAGQRIGTVRVGGDIIGGDAAVSGYLSASSFGRIEIHGSILGGDGERSGAIVGALPGAATQAIVIGGSLQGGAGEGSGSIDLGTNVGQVKITGSIAGGEGNGSGRLHLFGDLGRLEISGNIEGGSAVAQNANLSFNGSGVVSVEGAIGTVRLGGSILGGTGTVSGAISTTEEIRQITIQGDISGGEASFSGLFSGGGYEKVHLKGSVVGGEGTYSGIVSSGFFVNTGQRLTRAFVIDGDVLGGSGGSSGVVRLAGESKLIAIGGAVIGGTGGQSGSVMIDQAAELRIGGDVRGGTEDFAGYLGGRIGKVTVGGSVEGGSDTQTGYLSLIGLRSLRIEGDVVGGTGQDSGRIVLQEKAARLELGGSLEGGTGVRSGTIALEEVGVLEIGGSITGTREVYTGFTHYVSGSVRGLSVGQLHIGGDIVAAETPSGFATPSYALQLEGGVKTLAIDGSLRGSAEHRIGISLGNYAFSGDVRFAGKTGLGADRIEIGGSVRHAEIAAGYSARQISGNPDARIGTLHVEGGWLASSVTVGLQPGADGQFGTADDALVTRTFPQDPRAYRSQLGSVVIEGQVTGTEEAGDFFGCVAERIGSVKIGGKTVPLTSGPDGRLLHTPTADVAVREFSAALPG